MIILVSVLLHSIEKRSIKAKWFEIPDIQDIQGHITVSTLTQVHDARLKFETAGSPRNPEVRDNEIPPYLFLSHS